MTHQVPVHPTPPARRLVYEVVVENSLGKLEEAVNDELAKGGTLVGSPFAQCDQDHEGTFWRYNQAMMTVVTK